MEFNLKSGLLTTRVGQKWRFNALQTHLCFISNVVLADSFVLRNRHLLQTHKRYANLERHIDTMRKSITILTLGLQIALTFIVTFCIYIVFALLDSDFGFDGLFGLVIFQPIIAIIISGLTIFGCIIVGLPIRLYNKLNNWWTTNFYVSIIGTIIGLTLLFLALLPTFSETVTYYLDGLPASKQIPNSTFSYIGWLLTSFSILHTYPPRQLTEKIKSIFEKVFNVSFVALASLTITSCNNSSRATEKPTLLKADREAPLGWVYLTIYQHCTIEFTLAGIQGVRDVYKGKVEIGKDSLF